MAAGAVGFAGLPTKLLIPAAEAAGPLPTATWRVSVAPGNSNTDGPHNDGNFQGKAVSPYLTDESIQSIAWESSQDHLFIAQSNSTNNNLFITRYTGSGTRQSTNRVKHADHGEQIGCEPHSGGAIIWTGCDATLKSDGTYSDATSLGYFQFDNANDDIFVTPTRWPQPPPALAGTTAFTPYIDDMWGTIQIRYRSNGIYSLTTFNLAAMKAYIAGTGPAPAPLGTWTPTDPFTTGSNHYMSGHALDGQYSYVCWYNKDAGLNQIHRYNYNDQSFQSSGNLALSTGYSHKELEGMAIRYSGGVQYLYFGINDGASSGANLFNLGYFVGNQV